MRQADPRRRAEAPTTAWPLRDAAYLNARGVSFTILTPGAWDEVAPYVAFMGYTEPWYSVRHVEAPIGGEMGHLLCFHNPEGWPAAIDAGAPVGGHGAPISSSWRTDVNGVPTWGPTSRPVPQWTRPGATPADTLGRKENH